MEMPCRPPCSTVLAWYNVRTHQTEHACRGAITLATEVRGEASPLASVPLKFDCAVWADADTLHHRVRIVVNPFAAMRRPGFVGAEPPHRMSQRAG